MTSAYNGSPLISFEKVKDKITRSSEKVFQSLEEEDFSLCSKSTKSSGGSDLFVDNSDAISSNSNDNLDTNVTVMNSTLRNRRKTEVDESKYKTEVCKNWSETGQCHYGKKCKFAHGKTELVEKQVSNKNCYRSKKCKPFHDHLVCMYGVRCLFAHEQRTLKQLLARTYYNKYISCPTFLEWDLFKKQTRLPFFRKKAEEEKKVDASPFLSKVEDNEDNFQHLLLSFKTRLL